MSLIGGGRLVGKGQAYSGRKNGFECLAQMSNNLLKWKNVTCLQKTCRHALHVYLTLQIAMASSVQ